MTDQIYKVTFECFGDKRFYLLDGEELPTEQVARAQSLILMFRMGHSPRVEDIKILTIEEYGKRRTAVAGKEAVGDEQERAD